MNFIVIIPAYNPPATFDSLIEMLSEMEFVSKIIIVDDGSHIPIKVTLKKCVIIHHKRNCGKGTAIKTALEYINELDYKFLAFLDSDLIVEYEQLKRFLYSAYEHEDKIIIGYPINVSKKGFGIVKSFSKFVVKFYTKKDIIHPLSGQRIMPKSAIKAVNRIPQGYGIEVGTLIDFITQGFGVVEVPFDFIHDEKGKSWSDLLHKFNQLRDIFLVFITKWQEMI